MAEKVCVERDNQELVGAAEAAEILGTKVSQISRWLKADMMPPRVEGLKATTVWLRADVEAMAERRRAEKAAD